MNYLTFKSKTVIGSFILATITLGIIGIIALSTLSNLNQTVALKTLQGEILVVKSTIQEIDEMRQIERLDPLPAGRIGLILGPNKKEVLNSIGRFSKSERELLLALPKKQIHKFKGADGTYWVLNSEINSRIGKWQVLVLQSDEFGSILTKQTQFYLLFLGFFLLIISIFSFWILAGLVLKPVRKMQQKAQSMILSKENGNLPVPEPKDELRELAITLNELLDLLHNSLEREKRLVADVSHELRTPLSILQLRLEILMREELSRPIKGEIEHLSRTTAQMSDLVNNLLYLARDEKVLEPEYLTAESVKKIILVIIDQARILSVERNIKIEFDLSIESDILVNREAMQRVLTNLISNALNASDADSLIQISISEESEHVLLLVEDEGIGFSPEFMPNAFERFTRSDESRTRDSGGTGLGLAIVKSILERHGAQIELSNRDPKGARVKVAFRKLLHPSD